VFRNRKIPQQTIQKFIKPSKFDTPSLISWRHLMLLVL